MSSNRQITGGSGDVNPQTLSFELVESAANTFTEFEIEIPASGLAAPRGKAVAFELLKVLPWIPSGALTDGTSLNVQLYLRSRDDIGDFSDADMFYYMNHITQVVTSGGFTYESLKPPYNLTDDAGHGVLVAQPKIFGAIKGGSQSVALTAHLKILYRIKYVTLEEFIGLAISQQS